MPKPNTAVTTSFWRRLSGSGESPGRAGAVFFDAQSLIAAFPGPALLLDAKGNVAAANAEAARLSAALMSGQAQDLRELCAGITASGRPGAGQIMLSPQNPGEDRALYTLTGLPAGNGQVILFARDASAEYAMRQALITSRELYRDLARCSSDFSWQTDENGAFSFVSAKGALGFSAKALNGRSSLSFLEYHGGGAAPFVTRQSVESAEIHLRDAKGELRICLVHAVPVHDRENKWQGARGVCTDITEARLRQQALDAMRAREDQIRAIAEATQRAIDPAQGFDGAATIIAQATAAEQCAILALDYRGDVRVLGASRPPDMRRAPPGGLLQALEKSCRDPLSASWRTQTLSEGEYTHQTVAAGHGGKINGAIWLSWRKTATPPAAEETPRSLAQNAADYIGIAIAHANQLRLLENLSRTDALTGLLNRRAFTEDLQQRHAHRYRVHQPAALLYIDLDNFKPVNDQFGHAAGDKVLLELAALFQRDSRAGDLSARFGGDEFALWLEDTDASGAQAKAQHLISSAAILRHAAGIPENALIKPLGLSIGIAMVDPQIVETLDQVMLRADDAMYRVKQASKGGFFIADGAMGNIRSTEVN